MNRSCAHDYAAVIATPLPGGQRIGLCFEAEVLRAVDFLPASAPLRAPTGAAAIAAVAQFNAYFRAPYAARFDLNTDSGGTLFQRRVWAALQAIVPGDALTYGAVAQQLGSSARAVAAACRANPLPLVVPCHRVVAVHGPGGYMGARGGEPIRVKQWLLTHESR